MKKKNIQESKNQKIPLREEFLGKGKLMESSSELPSGILCRVRYPICNIGKKNRNNRVYEKAVWDKVTADKELREKLDRRTIFGNQEHPIESQLKLNKDETSHVISDILIEGDTVYADFDVLPTEAGKFINVLLEAGCDVGTSTRAEGELEEKIEEKTGDKYYSVKPETYEFITVDFTGDPSTLGSYPIDVQSNVADSVRRNYENHKVGREMAMAILEGLDKSVGKKLEETIDEKRVQVKDLKPGDVIDYQGEYEVEQVVYDEDTKEYIVYFTDGQNVELKGTDKVDILEKRVNEESDVIKYKDTKIRAFKVDNRWTWELPGTENAYGPGQGPAICKTKAEAFKDAKDYIDSVDMDEAKVVESSDDLVSKISVILKELFVDKELVIERVPEGWEIVVKGVHADQEGYGLAKAKIAPYIKNYSDKKIMIGGKGNDLLVTVKESKVNETGEMSASDIERGGEDFEWAQAIEKEVRRIEEEVGDESIFKFNGMKPFDKYQGPYASTNIGKIWSVSGDPDDDMPYAFYVEKRQWLGTPDQIISALQGDNSAIEAMMNAHKKYTYESKLRESEIRKAKMKGLNNELLDEGAFDKAKDWLSKMGDKIDNAFYKPMITVQGIMDYLKVPKEKAEELAKLPIKDFRKKALEILNSKALTYKTTEAKQLKAERMRPGDQFFVPISMLCGTPRKGQTANLKAADGKKYFASFVEFDEQDGTRVAWYKVEESNDVRVEEGIVTRWHNSKKEDTTVPKEHKDNVRRELIRQMNIDYALANEYIKSYEFKTTVNDESVEIINKALGKRTEIKSEEIKNESVNEDKKYGDKRDYKKLDIFVKNKRGNWQYAATTTWAKTPKEAAIQYANKNDLDRDMVKAKYVKESVNEDKYKLTEEQYKSDTDIAGEFKGMQIKKIDLKPSKKSGWIEIEFPEGGEHVGGGTDHVVDSWIKYDHNGKIAFDNWYPEDVYLKLVAAIEDKLKANESKAKEEKEEVPADKTVEIENDKDIEKVLDVDKKRKDIEDLKVKKDGKQKDAIEVGDNQDEVTHLQNKDGKDKKNAKPTKDLVGESKVKINEVQDTVKKLRAAYGMSEDEARDFAIKMQHYGIDTDKLIGASSPKAMSKENMTESYEELLALFRERMPKYKASEQKKVKRDLFEFFVPSDMEEEIKKMKVKIAVLEKMKVKTAVLEKMKVKTAVVEKMSQKDRTSLKELQEKYDSLFKNYVEDAKALTASIQSTKEKIQKEAGKQIQFNLTQCKEQLQEMKEKIDQINETSKKEKEVYESKIVELNEQVEKGKRELQEAVETSKKELLKRCFEIKMDMSGLGKHITSGSLTLLENCVAESDVDKLVEKVRRDLREVSGLPTKVDSVSIKEEKHANAISSKVGAALQGMNL